MPNFQDTLRNAAFESLSSDPAAPTGNAQRFYFNTTTKTMRVYDGTQWIDVGSSSGSGEINYISNPSAKSAITGWTASGAGITVARTTTAAELPRESLSPYGIKITPVSGTTDYVYTRFTMGDADKGKLLKIQWAQKSLSGYASGDLVVEMWTNSASNYGGSYTQLPVAVEEIAGGDYVMLTTFASTTADYYELRIRRAAGTTAIVLGDVVVGPGSSTTSVPVVSDWVLDNSIVSFSAGFGTVSNKSIYKKRIGDSITIVGYATAGTVSGTLAYFSLSGLTADSTKLPKSGGSLSVAEVGQFVIIQSGAPAAIYSGDFAGKLFIDSDAASQEIRFTTVVGTDEFQNQNASSVVGSGVGFYFSVTVPVAEYGSSAFIDTTQVEYAFNSDVTDATNTTAFGYGSQGVEFGAFTANREKYVKFRTPILPTDMVVFQVSFDGGTFWDDLAGNGNGAICGYTNQGSQIYGATLGAVDSTTVKATFGPYRLQSTSVNYADTGFPWSDISGNPLYRWRVVKSSNPLGLGTSADTFQPISDFSTGSDVPSTATYFDAAQLDFTGKTGSYMVAGSILYDRDSAVLTSKLTAAGLSTTSGNSATDLVLGSNFVQDDQAVTSWDKKVSTVPMCHLYNDGVTISLDGVALAAGQILYLKGYLDGFSAGAPNYHAKILAWKLG